MRKLLERGSVLNDEDRTFLNKVRGYYLEWPAEPDPATALRFRADGLGRLADIFEQVNQYEDGRLCRDAAIRSYDEMIRRGLAGPDVLAARLKATVLLHQTLERTRQDAAAEAVARRLIRDREPLSRKDKFQERAFALDHIRLGDDLARLGREAESRSSFSEGIARLGRLAAESPRDVPVLEGMMRALYIAGIRSKDRARADTYFRRLVACADAGLIVSPAEPKFLRYLGLGLSEVVRTLMADRPEEALAFQRRQTDVARKLAAGSPRDRVLRADLVTCAIQYAELCDRLGRPADAEVEIERAVEEGARMSREEPAVLDWAYVLAYGLETHAKILESTGRPIRAVEQLDRIEATLDPWRKMKDRPAGVIPRIFYARSHSGVILSRLGRNPEAAARLKHSLELASARHRPATELRLAAELLVCRDWGGALIAARDSWRAVISFGISTLAR